MKRIALAAGLLLATFSAGAQAYLTDIIKPSDSMKFEAVTSKGQTRMTLAVFPYKGGFTLGAGGGGLIADHVDGYAVFRLGGAYEKLSFVMAPGAVSFYGPEGGKPNSASDDGTAIVTIKGDGRTLADDVVRVHDAPKEYVLDVSGVDELSFRNYRGNISLAFGEVRLWKAGATPTSPSDPQASLTSGKVSLGKDLKPYFIRHGGWVGLITSDSEWERSHKESSISINRHEYTSGLRFTADQAFLGHNTAWAYFWLQGKYDKLSFIIGPRDNQSSNANGWLTVKGDGKILYEHLVGQNDLAEQVVLDVRGVKQLSFDSIDESSDFLGGLTFGVVDIYAYKAGVSGVPSPGTVNANLSTISKLPDATPLCSNIQPFSVRGVGKYNDTYFNGESSHYTFSMGGEKFSEGFILTTGNTLFDDNINSYASFDLAGQFDWVTFTVGTLTNHRVLDEDRIQVYADDRLLLETDVHCTWPNQVFTLPLDKCRVLRFAKPGTGMNKQTYIGIGDVMVFRGDPVPTERYFYKQNPDFPETVDLIDLCQRPYFHYVGRYLSTITNFDFNDCFKNGSSQKEFFQMKDGSKIYKGVMLETNIPPAFTFEDISLSEAIFIFLTGAGSSISASNVAAYTGVTAGAGLAGALAGGWAALNLVDGNHQSSAAAFNPYGQYETLTFTVANKSAFVDTDILGARLDKDNPVKLNVFADMQKIGEFTLTNSMSPQTYSLPINKCTQLMFWLECGETRSGQYVLYDMTLSKEKLIGAPDYSSSQSGAPLVSTSASQDASSLEVTPAFGASTKEGKEKKSKASRQKDSEPLVWEAPSRSGNEAIDTFLSDVTSVWNATEELKGRLGAAYSLGETWVLASDGSVFKCVSLLDGSGNRLSAADVQRSITSVIDGAKSVQANATLAKIGLPGATVGLTSLPFDKIRSFSSLVKKGGSALTQCTDVARQISEIKQQELETVQSLIKSAVNVGQYKSNDRVMILQPAPGETPPASMQRLEYFQF